MKISRMVSTNLYLDTDAARKRALMKAKSVNISCQAIEKPEGSPSPSVPRSDAAGRMAAQASVKYLEISEGGRSTKLCTISSS